ncbi:glutamate--cysteine ligase [Halorhodospira neutriphila]|uniref:Glutamate--cysteine ligase n=1 Tax=Halorhodospira neutriphila TaxID=168379 RepID=A0ABS1E5V7_9GAMM|nr:glutamate--cysteine ligase [Halorhodospira neutriphila]MBK1726145.1 glutamate--cysteine ligase [Halorhodospira neutriphila]
MGQEIGRSRFSRADFRRFRRRLKAETELLREALRGGALADDGQRIGLELEAWLAGANGAPAPVSDRVLARIEDPRVENELALFNLEVNTAAYPLAGGALRALGEELHGRWARVEAAAAAAGVRPALVGILPAVTEADLCLENMTPSPRYTALNEQVLALRGREPLSLAIEGAESLHGQRSDVMLEAAATSLQLHLQVPPRRAADYFNAAIALSAATVAVAANAPLLFGRRLWAESRIPLFEQAVAVTPLEPEGAGALARVGFGSGYARDGLYGFFVENRQHHPVLLPILFDTPPEELAHLRLHNGTIWRWNRPLVERLEGRYHLRLEHRVMAAGPTVADVLANAAFFYGAAAELAESRPPVVERLPFHVAEHNFYQAARYGLDAEVEWFDGWYGRLGELILERLYPAARRGLLRAGVPEAEAAAYLPIIEQRVASGQTGSAWQLAWQARYGRDCRALTRAYIDRAASGEPVHRWPL